MSLEQYIEEIGLTDYIHAALVDPNVEAGAIPVS